MSKAENPKKDQKTQELQELRKLPPDKFFKPVWYRPRKKKKEVKSGKENKSIRN